jgi:NAD(P)-dependent dehydrogenase (short-subunit alcohol dehydrogenase family)
VKPFLEFDEGTWEKVLAVNLTGSLLVGQEAGRRMAERGYGRIVNISSLSATFPSLGLTGYLVSKGGIEALTRAMAFELGPEGITVNTVAPGPIQTELMQTMLSDEGRAVRLARIPMGRLGEPADIASVIAFLASPDASWVNGILLTVDGGYSHAGPKVGNNE